jgi:hypothetical protein
MATKLPQIGYRRTQLRGSLGRESAFAPIGEAQALGAAAESIGESAKKIYTKHLELRLESVDLETQNQISRWETENKSKAFHKAEDLSEELEFDRTHTIVDVNGNKVEQLREQIPAYEVYPQLYRRQMQAILEAQSERIPNEKIRGQWFTGQMTTLNKQYAKAMEASVKEQEKYQERRTILNAKEALEAGNYHLAIEMAKGLNDPVLRQQTLDTINKTKETDDYNLAIIDEDMEIIQGSIDFLRLENYHDIGYLSKKSREFWIAKLERKKDQLLRRADDQQKISGEMTKFMARQMIANLKEQQQVPVDQMEDAIKQLMGLNAIGVTGTLPLAVQIDQWAKFSYAAGPITRLLPSVQKNVTANFIDTLDMKNNLLDFQIGKALESAVVASTNLYYKEGREWAYNNGHMSPQEFMPVTPNNMAEALANNREPGLRYFKITGKADALMDTPDARVLVNFINGSPRERKPAIFAEIVKGAGDAYPLAVQQLRDNGLEEGTAATMVISYMKGEVVGNIMLEGEARLKDRTTNWWTPEVSDAFADYTPVKFGTAFVLNPEHKRTLETALKYATAGLLTRSDIEKGTTKLLKARIQEAERLIGPLVEHGGSTVLAPEGFDQENWTTAIMTTASMELANMNDGALPVDSQTGKPIALSRLMNMIRKDENTVLQNDNIFGGGSYDILIYGQPVLSTSGKSYKFKPLPNPTTRDDVRKVEEVNEFIRIKEAEAEALTQGVTGPIIEFHRQMRQRALEGNK